MFCSFVLFVGDSVFEIQGLCLKRSVCPGAPEGCDLSRGETRASAKLPAGMSDGAVGPEPRAHDSQQPFDQASLHRHVK